MTSGQGRAPTGALPPPLISVPRLGVYHNGMTLRPQQYPVIMLSLAVGFAAYLALSTLPGHDHRSALVPTATVTPAPNPLQIDALRSRTYPGGPLTQTQDLGSQGGYRDTIVQFEADGITEYARLSTPAGTPPPGGWPVIVLLHGYVDPAAWQTTGSDYASIMGALARAGFAVIRPDYRGHGQSGGSPAGGHFAPDYTYDTLNLLASLKTASGLNAERVGIIGHSLGGHVALRTIVVSSQVKATAMMAGVTGSMYDIFYNWPRSPAPSDRPLVLVQGARQKLVEQYGDPKTNPGFWDSASAINYVKYVAGPVQINQDEADSVVPKLFADRLDAALRAAGKSTEYRVYPGDDHQFTANRTALMQNLVAFFTRTL